MSTNITNTNITINLDGAKCSGCDEYLGENETGERCEKCEKDLDEEEEQCERCGEYHCEDDEEHEERVLWGSNKDGKNICRKCVREEDEEVVAKCEQCDYHEQDGLGPLCAECYAEKEARMEKK